MSFVAGLLKGFNARSASAREEARLDQEKQDLLEEKALTMLAGADDPGAADIAARAQAALFERAAGAKAPKGGFLANLLGPKVQINPALQQLLKMTQQPAPEGAAPAQVSGSTPAPQQTPRPSPPPAVGAMGVPINLPPPPAGAPRVSAGGPPPPVGTTPFGPPEGGPIPPQAAPGSAAMAPPPSPGSLSPQAAAPPPSPGSTESPAGPLVGPTPPGVRRPLPGVTPTKPLPLFLTTTQKILAKATAEAEGKVVGDTAGLIKAGFTPEETRQIVKEDRLNAVRGGAQSFRPLDYEIPDGRGGWKSVPVTFNNRTGEYEQLDGTPLPAGARKATSTSSTSLGTYAERAARQLGFASASAAGAAGPAAMTRVNALAAQIRSNEAGQNASASTTARMGAEATGPLSRSQQFTGITGLQKTWQDINAPMQMRREQLALMETAVQRFAKDKIGSPETIRVTFEKILDPISVVREAEYARQTNGLSVGAKLEGLIQKWLTGGGDIPQDALNELVETARQFNTNVEGWVELEGQKLEDTARYFQLNPTLVRGNTKAANPGAPGVDMAAGAVPGHEEYTGLRRVDPANPDVRYGLVNGQSIQLINVGGKWYYPIRK